MIEGRISVLMRGRGMKRCRAQGAERFALFVAAAVLANNLMIIGKGCRSAAGGQAGFLSRQGVGFPRTTRQAPHRSCDLATRFFPIETGIAVLNISRAARLAGGFWTRHSLV